MFSAPFIKQLSRTLSLSLILMERILQNLDSVQSWRDFLIRIYFRNNFITLKWIWNKCTGSAFMHKAKRDNTSSDTGHVLVFLCHPNTSNTTLTLQWQQQRFEVGEHFLPGAASRSRQECERGTKLSLFCFHSLLPEELLQHTLFLHQGTKGTRAPSCVPQLSDMLQGCGPGYWNWWWGVHARQDNS